MQGKQRSVLSEVLGGHCRTQTSRGHSAARRALGIPKIQHEHPQHRLGTASVLVAVPLLHA